MALDLITAAAGYGIASDRLYLTADLPMVLLDRESFHAALLNLVLNAEQAMPDGGQLVVRTYPTAEGVGLDGDFYVPVQGNEIFRVKAAELRSPWARSAELTRRTQASATSATISAW